MIKRREFLIIFKISAGILTLMDKINVAEWFRAKSPSFARCKEGDLPLLNFSNLTCVILGFSGNFSGTNDIFWDKYCKILGHFLGHFE